MNTLQQFKIESGAERGLRGAAFNVGGMSSMGHSVPFEEPTRDSTAWFNNSLRDPDVWPPPPPRDNDVWHQPTATSARNAKAAATKRAEASKTAAKGSKTATLGRKSARTAKTTTGKPEEKTKEEKLDGEKGEKVEETEKKFDGSGYDGDLVEMLGKLGLQGSLAYLHLVTI